MCIRDRVNTLMIWDAEPMNCFELDSFDKGDYHKAVEQENLAKNLVCLLYTSPFIPEKMQGNG